MSLTDTKIRNAKLRDKSYKLADEKGLFLLVTPKGAKYWRFKYRFNKKEKLLAFGVYGDVTLAKARAKRDEARALLIDKKDPGTEKQIRKESNDIAQTNIFENIAREWHAKFSIHWTEKHRDRVIRQLEKDVFPWIGQQAIKDITAPELLKTLKRIESRGAIEVTHRALQTCSQIFRYGIATARAERDPAADLRGAFPPKRKKHHASITDPVEVGNLLRAINDYQGHFITKCALRFAPLTFVRPGELRKAEWSEINLTTREWRIPANKMKMKAIHIVPLSNQAVQILQEIRPLTGDSKYVFPCIRTYSRPMSENTINAALRRLGYSKEEATGHGFRSMASTLLNENGWNPDAIERQLAHTERNHVRAAYNYAEHLPLRREMMQWWADYLDKLSADNRIINLKIA